MAIEFARRRKIITENLARSVKKFEDGKNKRFLSLDEITALGNAMRDALKDEKSPENKTGVAAIQALLLTGCRKNEILALPWAWLDDKARCIRFDDTKSGAQIRPIGVAAVHHLKKQPKQETDKGDWVSWVFPSDKGKGHFIGAPKVFERLCKKAGIADVSLHTLRHTFASVAAELGFSELTIAGLLGHTVPGITARYAHVPDGALLVAADRVSGRIATLLEGKVETATILSLTTAV